MWIPIALVVLSQSPECRTSGGETACGFNCRAELGQVKCAQTPQGICRRLEQQLVCWDPPEEVRLHLDAGVTAAPVCKAKFREVVCGYACVTSPERIACAQTPWGACAFRHGDAECWDPSPEVVHAFSGTGELSGAKCVQTDQGIACGWDCKTSYRESRCAQTPRGLCTVIDGKLACFDPPLPPPTHATATSRSR